MTAPTTVAWSDTLNTLSCGACGIPFAVPSNWINERRDRGDTFYCPNGHPRAYHTTTETKLRAQLDQAQAAQRDAWQSAKRERERRQATERSNAALRGHLTRYRKRVANGVCPVAGCKRHFPDVQAHVATKHPEWLVEHPEVFES